MSSDNDSTCPVFRASEQLVAGKTALSPTSGPYFVAWAYVHSLHGSMLSLLHPPHPNCSTYLFLGLRGDRCCIISSSPSSFFSCSQLWNKTPHALDERQTRRWYGYGGENGARVVQWKQSVLYAQSHSKPFWVLRIWTVSKKGRTCRLNPYCHAWPVWKEEPGQARPLLC